MNMLQQIQALTAATPPIVEFKAGMLERKGTTVTADPRRGTLKLVQAMDGSCAVWERCTECKTGRVYVLRFKQGSRRRFFWMQEVSEDRDEEFAKKIQEAIDNPPPPPMAHMDPSALDALGDDGGAFENDLSAQQLMQLLGQGAGAGAGTGSSQQQTPATRSAPRGSPPPAPRAAQPASANAQPQADAAAMLMQYAQQLQQQQRQAPPVSLPTVLEADRVIPQLDEAMINDLLQYLPEGQRTREDLIATLRSPQLRQAGGRLSEALNSAQYGAVMASLGLPPGNGLQVADAERKAAPAPSQPSSQQGGQQSQAAPPTEGAGDLVPMEEDPKPKSDDKPPKDGPASL